ncbi:hypothetical protein [Nonomuraea sp. SYSU D8015]|uniref:hypothetical protein n=1 Tax=Nonomuraea sp. SYSU D8015 TaxID=2593644 RepID=UPI0016608A2E|nr:hypothetical protein [Nonomuraea sp. SYSU D8015]
MRYTHTDGRPAGEQSSPPYGDAERLVTALAVYDQLTTAERRALFENMFAAMLQYRRTREVEHLTRSAESVTVTMWVRGQPGVQQAIRDAPTDPCPAEDLVPVDDVIRMLREDQP